MPREVTIDVRGLAPPEPMECVLDALDDLGAGDRLVVLIDVEPHPLYRALELDGWAHSIAPGTNATFEVTIWRK